MIAGEATAGTVTCEEWQSIAVAPDGPLSQADVSQLLSGWRLETGQRPERFFEISERSLTPRNWVGVIAFGGKRLQVVPRGSLTLSKRERAVVDRNIARMLAASLIGSSLEAGMAEMSEQGARIHSLMAAFLTQLEVALRAARPRRYAVQAEPTRCPRGRIAFPRQALDSITRPAYFSSEWVQLSQDTPENRYLKMALKLVSGWSYGDIRLRAERLLTTFDSVDDVAIGASAWATVRFDRLLVGYRRALELARMVVERQSPGFFAGGLAGRAEIVFTPRAFERFLASEFSRIFAPQGLHVVGQVRGWYLGRWIADGNTGRPRPAFELVPDVLVRDLARSESRLLVDAKWKALDPSRANVGVARQDVYQILAYMRRFKARQGLLVYPWFSPEPPFDGKYATEVRLEGEEPSASISVLGVSLLDEGFGSLSQVLSEINAAVGVV